MSRKRREEEESLIRKYYRQKTTRKKYFCVKIQLKIIPLIFFFFFSCSFPLFIYPLPKIRVALPDKATTAVRTALSFLKCAFSIFVCPNRDMAAKCLGYSTCAEMLMNMIAHGVCMDAIREFALKVDSGRKILRRTGESNMCQRRADPTLYQLSYIPPPRISHFPVSFTYTQDRVRKGISAVG